MRLVMRDITPRFNTHYYTTQRTSHMCTLASKDTVLETVCTLHYNTIQPTLLLKSALYTCARLASEGAVLQSGDRWMNSTLLHDKSILLHCS